MFIITCCTKAANSSDLLTSSNPARTYFLYLYGRLGFFLLLRVNLLGRGSRRHARREPDYADRSPDAD